MRIIAGEFRGRTLLSPKGTGTTRPVTDRVKQSVFDILAPLIPDAVVYDCFSGTGSMGLECLSRGARRAVFFDADRSALSLLKQNVKTLGVGDRSQVVGGDLFRWFETAAPPPGANRAALIFLDPPYRLLIERADDLKALARRMAERHATPDATLVFRHDAKDRLDLPSWRPDDAREYGGMTVELLRPAQGGHEGPPLQ